MSYICDMCKKEVEYPAICNDKETLCSECYEPIRKMRIKSLEKNIKENEKMMVKGNIPENNDLYWEAEDLAEEWNISIRQAIEILTDDDTYINHQEGVITKNGKIIVQKP